MFPGHNLFFTPHIFRLGGLFRDFRNTRDLDHLVLVKVSPYLTTKWNDVKPSIHFLIRKGVLINDVNFFYQIWNLKRKSRNSLEYVQRLASKPAVGQVFLKLGKWRISLRTVEDFTVL